MKALFSDSLSIGFAPAELTVARERGLLRKKVVESRTIACDPGFGAQPWDGALAALAGCPAGLPATVVLSNHFVRYAVVPWSEALEGDAEEEAFVRHHFARIHGERAAGWALRWTDHGPSRLASAIDKALLEALRQALPRLRSVQPYLMAAINRNRGKIPRGGAWLALVEADRTCVALHTGGRWRSVQNAKGAWRDVLDRERHRAEGAVPDLALLAGARAEADLPGWRLRMLEGGLAH